MRYLNQSHARRDRPPKSFGRSRRLLHDTVMRPMRGDTGKSDKIGPGIAVELSEFGPVAALVGLILDPPMGYG